MTRKDFELIAEVLAVEVKHLNDEAEADIESDPVEMLECIAFRFADELANTNPNFDRDRFLKAAGVTT